MKFILAASSLALATGAAARTFIVKNNCAYTVWPAIYTMPGGANPPTSQPNGWEADAGTSVTFDVPDNWSSGRIWGRNGCDASGNCVTGGCTGGIVCTGIGAAPQTLAEFTLTAYSNLDFYDISVVDGFNIPMSITTDQSSCTEASCPVDLNAICPAELKGPTAADGTVDGCNSACLANLDGTPNNSNNCCSGSFNTAATCPVSGVQDYSFFKNNCPNSYCYPFDESSNTAVWACSGTLNPTYTITFCPAS
ncbi:hypothetical protein SERLA73DRAFT_72127 [Serpula lacrymans var. lacrymans S7.3]|uniref:Thaumatin-like protein n=2 Tax=Serpula lacrymans var. lacrymans TaxID=341189 RepID=F8PRM0_SERL3|nr:uncharacterized protein SERLADRAFT_436638 [Serpula lacrymans var. lacrymans S7.9]EGO01159.1 hypothetical protein SERLA73DRAFT_72127 [Serpula lacrymans var. lacrymans S7.3]EGO26810.1 hypothetical protein SERLADRAFT_436638 [Serpula lacrymans var. lacrymans S7.9]